MEINKVFDDISLNLIDPLKFANQSSVNLDPLTVKITAVAVSIFVLIATAGLAHIAAIIWRFSQNIQENVTLACAISGIGLSSSRKAADLPIFPVEKGTAMGGSSSTGIAEKSKVFPTLKKAQALLTGNDEFLSQLTVTEMQLRMSEPTDAKANREKVSSDFKNHLKGCVVEVSDQGRGQLLHQVQKMKIKFIELGYGALFPEDLNFVFTNGKDELSGTLAYTLEHTIVLCNGEKISDHLLAHELFHIISRFHPELRKDLYETIKFKTYKPLRDANDFLFSRITNPDAPRLDTVIELNGELVLPYDFDYTLSPADNCDKGYFAKLATKGLIVRVGEDGHLKPIEPLRTISIKSNKEYQRKAQVGPGYIDSAEEIIAEYKFEKLVMNPSCIKDSPLLKTIHNILVKYGKG